MNEKIVPQIVGALNLSAETKDFFEEYTAMGGVGAYSYDSLNGVPSHGIMIMTLDDKFCINVPLSLRSFMNLKFFIEPHINPTNTSHNAIHMLCKKFGMDVIMAYIKDVTDDDYFETYLVFYKEHEILSIKLAISDVLCMRNLCKIPLYMNNEILEKRKLDYSEVKSRFMQLVKEGDKNK